MASISKSTNRKDIAAAIITVQSFRNVKCNSIGTLVKKPVAELQEMLTTLLGTDLQIDEAGKVTKKVVKAAAPAKKAAKAKPAKAAKEPKGQRGQGNAHHALDDIITVLVAENPKREGSMTRERFAQLRSGMTIREFIAACEKVGSGRRARRTIRKALAAGQITVSKGEPEGAAKPVAAKKTAKKVAAERAAA